MSSPLKPPPPPSISSSNSRISLSVSSGQANYSLAKAGVTGLAKTIAKEWGPQFGVRANTIAFGHIQTRLTDAKEIGAFITTPDGSKVALGIPQAQIAARGRTGDVGERFKDIPLRRAGSPTDAAKSILAVASPLFSYVS